MLPGWSQCGTYQLQATSTDETNFFSRIIVPIQSGMKSDFADVRFVDSDNLTLIPYHRFDYTSGVSGTFIIKVPEKPAAGKMIYIYWNNPDAEDASDIANVYVFSDEFNGDLSKWKVIKGNIDIYESELRVRNAAFDSEIRSVQTDFGINFGIIYKMKFNSQYTTAPVLYLGYRASSPANLWGYYDSNSTLHQFVVTGSFYIDQSPTLRNNGSYNIIEQRRIVSNNYKFWLNGVYKGQIAQNYYTGYPIGVLFLNNFTGTLLLSYLYVFKLPSDGTEIIDITGDPGAPPIETVILTISVSPEGGGEVDPDIGDHEYDLDEIVDLLAIPAEGYQFDHWEGDVADPDNPSTTVTMDDDKIVTAVFILLEQRVDLAVAVVGLKYVASGGDIGSEILKAVINEDIALECTPVIAQLFVSTAPAPKRRMRVGRNILFRAVLGEPIFDDYAAQYDATPTEPLILSQEIGNLATYDVRLVILNDAGETKYIDLISMRFTNHAIHPIGAQKFEPLFIEMIGTPDTEIIRGF